MTQTTQETETLKQTEDRLWSEYVAASTRERESWQLEDRFWHEYVQTGLQDAVARENWRTYADKSHELSQCSGDAYRAWQQVAYPLYNLAHILKGKDED